MISDQEYENAQKIIEEREKQEKQRREAIHEEKMKNLVGKFFEQVDPFHPNVLVVLKYQDRHFQGINYEQWCFYNKNSYGCKIGTAYDRPENCKEITSIEYYEKVQQILALIGVKPE